MTSPSQDSAAWPIIEPTGLHNDERNTAEMWIGGWREVVNILAQNMPCHYLMSSDMHIQWEAIKLREHTGTKTRIGYEV